MSACQATTLAGEPCRRPASRGEAYCLAHSPDRKDEHAEASRAGGIARHDPEVSAAKAEIRDVKAALWSGKVTPGAASVLLQAIRLEREIDAEDRRDASGDMLVMSIQRLRDNPDVPDLSEPAAPSANAGGGGITGNRDPDELDREIEVEAERRGRFKELDAKTWSELTADERQWLKGERVRRRMQRWRFVA